MQFQTDDIIKTALNEDINYIDVTTDLLVDENAVSTAKYVSKDEGVLCGIDIAMRVFTLIDPETKFEILIHDGERVKKGDIIARITGKTRVLLKGERTALNLVQHMSGIATATNKLVQLTEGTKASIADTRKTLPGLRAIQKYAVTVGGGRNHRYNLSDCVMLKDTHLDAYGSITNAVKALREKLGHTVKIEVEVGTLEELKEALETGVEIIMLDNMSCELMAEAVKIADGRAKLEASGNVSEQTVRAIAQTGVDIISVGAITHSVKAFDISMKIEK
ncbi:MAG: carboxylating nicotinate-nucleotide diphosphorylase [Ruminococcus sp.]|nr:carboxylating nicotinate-nucleotide diphosphorylase [Ruminococcus sp.]MBR2304804.1 carboxylating nicotinate-nucleotide diphosphorylase [Ruminococcus sp.]